MFQNYQLPKKCWAPGSCLVCLVLELPLEIDYQLLFSVLEECGRMKNGTYSGERKGDRLSSNSSLVYWKNFREWYLQWWGGGGGEKGREGGRKGDPTPLQCIGKFSGCGTYSGGREKGPAWLVLYGMVSDHAVLFHFCNPTLPFCEFATHFNSTECNTVCMTCFLLNWVTYH